MDKLKKYAKLIAALIGAAINAGALSLVPEKYQLLVGVIVAMLTALGVYAVPNTDGTDPETDPDYEPASAD